jgi:hypothetical protein
MSFGDYISELYVRNLAATDLYIVILEAQRMPDLPCQPEEMTRILLFSFNISQNNSIL